MREFASRTHQSGTPELARDYLPAEIDLAAMPVRIESGSCPARFATGSWAYSGAARRAPINSKFASAKTLAAHMHDERLPNALGALGAPWRPPATGVYAITLRAADPSIRTRRLDTGYYLREVEIDEIDPTPSLGE
jgi:hypothetical protein